MNRNFPFVVGEFYHLYNRGVNKMPIFNNDTDRKHFLFLLYICNGTNAFQSREIKNASFHKMERGDRLIDIGAYCLMGNHFHIMARERVEKGISRFMGKLGAAYTMYFNKKNGRTGSLFESRFKAKHIDNDPYFNWVFSYIHMNPVAFIEPEWKEGIANIHAVKDFLEEYKWSSYIDHFVGKREESVILNKEDFPDSFVLAESFEELFLDFNENKLSTP